MNRLRLGVLGLLTACGLAAGCAMSEARSAAAPPKADGSAAPVFSAASAPAGESPSALPDNPTVADYVSYAAAHNPALAAAEARWNAARERVPQARALDDPRLAYRAALSRDMRTQEVTVEQMFPWFGKLEGRAAVAAEEAEAARARVEAERLRVAYQVRTAYYEYYYLARSIDIVRANRDLVRSLGDEAMARYRTGGSGQPDVIRSQVELGKLNDQWRTLEDSRGAAAARLNAALARPTETPVPWPAAVPEEEMAVADAEVLAALREASPELKALAHEVERERQAADLARKDYWPDIGLGIGYMNQVERTEGSDDHMVVGMISISLPIWREKYDAEVREAEWRREAAARMRSDRENLLAADVKMALYGLRDARRRIDLYRDTLVPKARESLGAVEAAFRTGAANFVDLVDGQRMLLEFQLMVERARVDRAERLAELEMLVGRPLTGPATEPASK